jgi:hypothetical protein
VAAQIEPQEGHALLPEQARSYLESYFSKDANINVYWGAVSDFVVELQKRWNESG